ncbi:hypothetical protein ABZT51_43250, partial [Streptomyces sp. NPDC005373]|uniref:hypothetical protein n=1 Tax=Streptomyces sp. NPDC005373 TaxID=3156879 RepID=UPI0033AFFEAC
LERYDDTLFTVFKTIHYVEHAELTATSEVVETLRRSNTSTRWPAARSSSTSWSTTLFSPLGCAEA